MYAVTVFRSFLTTIIPHGTCEADADALKRQLIDPGTACPFVEGYNNASPFGKVISRTSFVLSLAPT